jgi:hypothetical protein
LPEEQVPPWHEWPHDPQFVPVLSETHAPPHTEVLAGHEQTPPEQEPPVGHAEQFDPQWSASVDVFQHPLAHAVKPASHA